MTQEAVLPESQQPTTCYACGTENPVGLHVRFERAGEGSTRGTFVPTAHHEGWPGVVHGGILATLMDEAMAYALWFGDHRAVTARMEARFRRSVRAGDRLTITAKILTVRRGVVDAQSSISLPDGSTVAEATGRFVPADVSY